MFTYLFSHDKFVLQFKYYSLQASAVPKKAVKVTDSTSSAATGGMDGLPREDISEKITPTLLKGLESSDWKVFLIGNQICE